MKNFKLTIFLLLVSLITLTAKTSSASTQPSGKDVVLDQLPEYDRTIAEDIADFLGLGDLFDGVLDFLESMETTNDRVLETRTPDWSTIENAIEGTQTKSKELERQLEDRVSDSYHANQAEAEQIQRELIQEAVVTNTTSADAQKIMAASLVDIEDAAKKSGQLSQDSAGRDVSQQILQNISEQAGINTQLLSTIASQNVQSQKDRANQIMLGVQQAKHNAAETARRQRDASVANDLGITAWGAISTPLFLYEEPTP